MTEAEEREENELIHFYQDKVLKLEEENEQLKAYESHWDEIEEDAKRIAEENAELKEKLKGFENGEVVFIGHYEAVKCYPILKERFEAQIEKEKWHDLRKDPNDLPTENDKYCCYVYEYGYEIHRFDISKNCFLGVFSRVVAWCELPNFEEE